MAKRASNPAKEPTDGLSFEQSIQQVESIIERIESGEMGLEEQIERYAEGAALLKRCRDVLERCEQRVEEISSDLDRRSEPAPADEDRADPEDDDPTHEDRAR